MRIIRIITGLSFILISLLFSESSPSNVYYLNQPDGYRFSVRMFGSEYYNYIETTDGYTISSKVQNNKIWWYYAIKVNGQIESSNYLVNDLNSPPIESYKLKPDLNKNKYRQLNNANMKESLNSNRNQSIKPLVILVNFIDATLPVPQHSYNREQFAALFFNDNLNPIEFNIPESYNMSISDYFNEISNNNIQIIGDISSVTEWITMPEDYSYYVDQNQGLGVGDGGISRSAKAVLIDALDQINIDLGDFDDNSDGVCDGVIMIMEGWGNGSANQFWSFKGSLIPGESELINSNAPTDIDNELSYDGIKIRNYIVTTEQMYYSDEQNYSQGYIRPIGTICHEIGHLLGLPDLYDTSDNNAPGIGDWGLMGSGNWNNQVSPSRPCAWSSDKLEIVDTIILEDVFLEQIILEPINISNTIFKIIIGEDYSGEYLLLENRLSVGTDNYLAASGMLVWHIDDRLTSTYPFFNEINTFKEYYGVRLLERGGTDDLSESDGIINSHANHVFDGTGITALNDDTTPSLKGNSYDRDADGSIESSVDSDILINNIIKSGNNIQINLSKDDLECERIIYSETGVEAVYSGQYIPGVIFEPGYDTFLKIVQTPILNSALGTVDSIELSVYEVVHGNNITQNNPLCNYSQEINFSDERESGTIDLYLDSCHLISGNKYYIQIKYNGPGSIIPAEIGFHNEIIVSGNSKWNNNGTLVSIGDADFSITLSTSRNQQNNLDDSYIYTQFEYPYPNPTKLIVNINIESPLGLVNIIINDLLGREVYSNNYNLISTNNKISIPVGHFSSGVYFIKIIKDNKIENRFKFSIYK